MPDPGQPMGAFGETVNDDLDHIFGEDPELVDEDAPDLDRVPDPAESFPGGTAEMAALAAHDANDLLRFVESAMTAPESEAFLAEVRGRDPETATRLVQMRDDHRLLRTSLDLEVPSTDLLGPVRARIARGELVQVQSEFSAEAADPTEFMSRAVTSLAQRRRRARRRPFVVAALFGIVGVLVGLFVARELRPLETATPAETIESTLVDDGSASSHLASFGLLLPVADPDRIESAIAMLAVDHEAVLVRNLADEDGDEVAQPRPIVGPPAAAPDASMRTELGRRGFGYAVVVPRDEVSTILAQIGNLAEPGPEGRTSARLVPSSSDAREADFAEDAWTNWSRRTEATEGLPADATRLVVPIAMRASSP